MSLPVQFTGIPTRVLTQACCDLKNSGNTLSVFLTIVRNILQFPEGRKELKKELSLRYIGEQLNMHFANVHKAIKKLVRKGYIRVIELGTDGIGSIIELIIPDENRKALETVETTGKEKAVVKDTTPVVKDTTPFEKAVVKSTTKDNNPPYLRTNEEPLLPAPVVCSQKSKIEGRAATRGGEFSPIGSILPVAIPVPAVSSPESSPLIEKIVKDLNSPAEVDTRQQEISEDVRRAQAMLEQKRQAGRQSTSTPATRGAAETSVTIPGITSVVLTSGIQFLRDRNITDINQALKDIKSQMETQDGIHNKKSYFLHLCKEKKNFSKPVEQKKETRQELEQKKREEEFRQIEEQRRNEDVTETFESLARQYPEEIKTVVIDVNNRPGSRFASGLTKLIMYVTEFRLRFNT